MRKCQCRGGSLPKPLAAAPVYAVTTVVLLTAKAFASSRSAGNRLPGMISPRWIAD
jgi:hypothetical protein